jgi:hypothetical protein
MNRKNTWRAAVALAAMIGASSLAAAAAPDLSVADIDFSGLKVGGCDGRVALTVENSGDAIGRAYAVRVELRVVPAGDTFNAKTYSDSVQGFDAQGRKTFTFDGVRILKSGYATSFEAKVYVTGGSFREGNTRNNQKRLSQTIQTRCPGGITPTSSSQAGPASKVGGSPQASNGQGSSPAATSPVAGAAGGDRRGAPDLSVADIDFSGLKVGGCDGRVALTVENSGDAIGRAYAVRVELRVVPAGDTFNAKTYSDSVQGFDAQGRKTFTFDGVRILKSGYATSFEAKVYVTGGSFREGNTRNNQKRLSQTIQTRCPR